MIQPNVLRDCRNQFTVIDDEVVGRDIERVHAALTGTRARRWIIGGGFAVAIAAAVIGSSVVIDSDR